MTVPGPYLGSGAVAAPNFADESALSIGKQEADRLDLRRIVGIFKRRQRLFWGTFAASIIVSALVVLWLPTLYTADAEVVLETRNTQAPQVLVPGGTSPRDDAQVNTELEVLNSRDLAASVVDSLGLMNDPAFNPWIKQRNGLIASVLKLFKIERVLKPIQREQLRFKVLDNVRDGLNATRIGNSYSFEISYTSADGARAAQLANAYANAYVEDQRNRKRLSNQRDAEFLKSRIEELREQARVDVRNVQQYRIANNLLSTTGPSFSEQDLTALNQQLTAALGQQVSDEARLAAARSQLASGSLGDNVTEALGSGVIVALRTQRGAISTQVAQLKAKYGPLHPDLKLAETQLHDIDAQIQAEVDRILSSLSAQAEVSRNRVNSLRQSIENAQQELAKNTRATVELDDLQRRAATSQALYESYLNAYKETVARQGIEGPDARVVSEARIPASPSQPRVGLILLFGTLFGAGLGLSLSFIAELNFPGLTTGQDVEDRLGAPYLGLVPSNRTTVPHAETILETIAKYPQSPVTDSVSNLLTSVQFATERRPQVIYVTSSLPGEGKTTLAAALGSVAALHGESAVVVDCDRVRRGLNRLITSRKTAGLQDVLAGTADIDAALVEDPLTGCAFLPITKSATETRRPNQPARLVYPRLMAELRERFSAIILDGPPMLTIAESRELSLYADFVILAVRWRKTADEAVRESLRLLPMRARRVTGIALTRVNLRQQTRYSPSDYTYLSNPEQYYLTEN